MLEILRDALSRHIVLRLARLYFIMISDTCLTNARVSIYDPRTNDEQQAQLQGWLTTYKADLANLDLVILRQHLQILLLQQYYKQVHILTKVTANPTRTITHFMKFGKQQQKYPSTE